MEDKKLVEFGRNNLALTIHVPNACNVGCNFCIANSYYKNGGDIGEIIRSILMFEKEGKYGHIPIKDIVITGGEPFSEDNIKMTSEILGVLDDMYQGNQMDVNVYINTMLPRDTFNATAAVVNHYHWLIEGLNVSRHGLGNPTYHKMFATDVELIVLAGLVPIRINCVVGRRTPIQAIIDKWMGIATDIRNEYGNDGYGLELSFREDFTKTVQDGLHTLATLPVELARYPLVNHTQCHVCDTLIFEAKRFSTQELDNYNMSQVFNIRYHKSLKYSSIKTKRETPLNNKPTFVYEINDIIIMPDGTIHYDWELDKDYIETLDEAVFFNTESGNYGQQPLARAVYHNEDEQTTSEGSMDNLSIGRAMHRKKSLIKAMVNVWKGFIMQHNANINCAVPTDIKELSNTIFKWLNKDSRVNDSQLDRLGKQLLVLLYPTYIVARDAPTGMDGASGMYYLYDDYVKLFQQDRNSIHQVRMLLTAYLTGYPNFGGNEVAALVEEIYMFYVNNDVELYALMRVVINNLYDDKLMSNLKKEIDASSPPLPISCGGRSYSRGC